MKKVSKTTILDKLHRGFVWTCMGVSLTGVAYIGLIGWNYYMYVKPHRVAEGLRTQQELLREGTGLKDTEELAS